MSVVLEKPKVTPEELLRLPKDRRYELVDGELVEKPMSATSGAVGGELMTLLGQHIRAQGLGALFNAETGYRCFADDPDKVRKPDISFIGRDKISAELWETGFIRTVPDLVVEVLSPSDVSYEVDRRVQDYLSAGVKLVWVVHPQSRSVHVYRPGGQGVILSERDELDGEQVLPGFRLPVREIFRPLEQLPQTGSGPSKGMSG
jgi:Uma2 family endonuclease